MIDKKALENSNISKIDASDVFLYSYPRSGNTWARLVLCDVISNVKLDINVGDDLPFDWGYLIPTITKHDFDLVDNYNPLGFRLIKTHKHSEAKDNKFIYIYRNPLDSLRSYFRFKYKTLDGIGHDEKRDFFLLESMKWVKHLNQVKLLVDRQPNNYSVHSYEGMLADAESEFIKMADFLGLHCDRGVVAEAISNQSMVVRRQKFKPSDSYNLGEGEVGLGELFFANVLDDEIKCELFEVYNQMRNIGKPTSKLKEVFNFFK